MSKFYVDVQFKKQGCFSVEVLANDKQEATQKALNLVQIIVTGKQIGRAHV